MKKIIVLITSLMMSVSAFATDLTAGGRINFGYNRSDFDHLDSRTTFADFGFIGFVNIPLQSLNFGPGTFGIQPELGLIWREPGAKYTIQYPTYTEEHRASVSCFSIDLPALLTYNIPLKKRMFIQPEFGPRISINILDDIVDSGSGVYLQVGLILGATFGFNLGPGTIIGNARYFRDITEMDGELSLRGFDTSVGYQIKL